MYIVNSQIVKDFILSHRTADVRSLALSLKGFSSDEARFILCQIEGWQRLRAKVPEWVSLPDLRYPERLPLEQCSSQAAAEYKAGLVEGGELFIDLTGGLGVDFSFMARQFRKAVYVERNADLCRLARHNFPLLGLSHAEIIEGDGVEHLQNMTTMADVVFLDPFRRDEAGRKTVLIEDCTPNVLQLLPVLQQKTRRLLVKLSPMLDISSALRALSVCGVSADAHIVGVGGEVKEVLIDIDFSQKHPDSSQILCREDDFSFSFTLSEEQQAVANPHTPTETEGMWLFEPCATVMKAGPFRLLAQRYGLVPLHPNSHLYFGNADVPDFPGRRFRVLRISSMGKQDQRLLRGQRANLAVRNFPLSVAQIRAKLHLLDGGQQYWFATTLADNSHALIICEKELGVDRV